MTIYLVRHAVALPREQWDDMDHLRPLDPLGERQAKALIERFHDLPLDAVYSSPAVRCIDTVRGIAQDRGLPVEVDAALAEGRGADGTSLIDLTRNVILCGHGDNLPEILRALTAELDAVPEDPPFRKGGTWTLGVAAGRVATATYAEPPE